MNFFTAKLFKVRLLGVTARIALVSFSCFFLSSSALLSGAFTSSEPTTVVAKESTSAMLKSEGTAAPVETPAFTKSATRAVKTTKKGVVYLPVVSLSSYLPMVAQILLMILVISLSGIFGAWLMFRTLAKKVLAVEEASAKKVQAAPKATPVVEKAPTMPAPKAEPSIKEFYLSLDKSQQKILAPVLAQSLEGKQILRNAQAEIYRSRVEKRRRTLVLGSDKSRSNAKNQQKKEAPNRADANASRVVLKNAHRRKPEHENASVASPILNERGKRIPSRFLINDWFPLDH